jgi:hypothetical protein
MKVTYWDRYEYTIAQHFLPGLINGDYSGFEGLEEVSLKNFMKEEVKKLPENAISHHWAVDVEECTKFAKCEITGLYASVSDVALVFQIPE